MPLGPVDSHSRLRDWYVSGPDGTAHHPRESDGVHHSTMCGRYVRGEARPVLADRPGRPCPECVRRTDVGYALKLTEAAAADAPPEALTLGRALSAAQRHARRGRAQRQPNH